MYPSIHPSIHPSIYLSTYLPIYLSIYLSSCSTQNLLAEDNCCHSRQPDFTFASTQPRLMRVLLPPTPLSGRPHPPLGWTLPLFPRQQKIPPWLMQLQPPQPRQPQPQSQQKLPLWPQPRPPPQLQPRQINCQAKSRWRDQPKCKPLWRIWL